MRFIQLKAHFTKECIITPRGMRHIRRSIKIIHKIKYSEYTKLSPAKSPDSGPQPNNSNETRFHERFEEVCVM